MDLLVLWAATALLGGCGSAPTDSGLWVDASAGPDAPLNFDLGPRGVGSDVLVLGDVQPGGADAGAAKDGVSTGDQAAGPADGAAGPAELGGADGAVADGAAPDVAMDAQAMDAQAMDAQAMDAQAMDAQAMDAQAMDAQAMDAQAMDTQALDTQALDAQALDAQAKDSLGVDTSTADAKTDASTDGAPVVYDPGPCKKKGSEACGKGISGDPAVLYVCNAKLKWEPLQTCEQACEIMSDGVPDRCVEDLVPFGSLVTYLDVTPYVEQNCKATTFPDWPYAAKECTYQSLGLTTTVKVANPSADKVAEWIVDSAAFMPAVWSLRYRDPPSYKKALKAVANGVLGASSRIFPLQGGIIEQMSGMASPVVFNFYHGVTQGCSTGCYCRINSMSKSTWCAYQAFLGKQTYDACLTKIGPTGLTQAWGDRCFNNHVDSWKSHVNHHFRAVAHQYHQTIKGYCATAVSCSPTETLAALAEAMN
ncbi:MAG: hypothetical protein FJ100_20875 [Deltaproteobacteria bacterium]|nr:hypothetical protein [Deltaproteobacteria bacterium]